MKKGTKRTSKKVKKIRSAAQLKEAFPEIGVDSPEDAGWRSLTQAANRDLNQLTQKKMQDIAFYLYDGNPLAHRIIEIMHDFVIGDGFRFKAKDEKVQEVLDNFWNDPDNNMDVRQDSKALELSLWGEQCYPVYVNKHTGHVKLGYLDPGVIVAIKRNRNNPERLEQVVWQKRLKRQTFNIINSDSRKRSETSGRLVGECFYFAINKVVWAARGRSDLLPLADWIDGYDQFLFARLERAFYLNSFVWDVLCEGMSKTEITEFAKDLQPPKPGSIRIHNEKIKWDVISPKLESSDASNEAGLFKSQILGGIGFPGHWFAEGDKTTRATAMEMALPTLKKLKSRQREFKNIIIYMFNFVIDQAIIAGMLDKNVDRKFIVIPSPIITKDARALALTVEKFSTAMSQAVEAGWITEESAKTAFNMFMVQLGIELEDLENVQSEKAKYKKAKGGNKDDIEDDNKDKKTE